MITVKEGDTLISNWGAMYPIEETTVLYVSNGCVYHQDLEASEDEPCDMVLLKDIKQPGETSVNGSPIGIFVKG